MFFSKKKFKVNKITNTMKYVGHGSYNDHEFFIKDHFYMGPTKSTQGNKESN